MQGSCFAPKAARRAASGKYRAVMSGSQPPGWYPAPGSPAVEQWWDGIRWTGEVREARTPGGKQALTAKFADGPTAPTATRGPSMTGPSATRPAGTGGWTISWPGTGPTPARAPKKAKKAKQASAPVAEPAPAAQAQEAAWRAPAAGAWEARTNPESARKSRRRGRTKHD